MNISVVIPSYNRLNTLPQAIDSVLSQTLSAHEIIVIDDGSSDGTSEFIQQHYPNITLITQNNAGVSHARNQGIKRASGDWIAFLDSDDTWFKHKLATQIQAIQQQPESVLCHCDEHWIRNGKRVNPMNKHRKQGGWIFEHCLPLCAMSPSAVLIQRQLFNKVGLFDESLPACEDYDLWLRICSQYPVLYVDQALLEKTGGHDDQLSRKHWGMDRFRLHALAKLLRSNTLTKQQHEQTLKTFNEKINIVINGSIKRGKQSEADELKQMYAELLNGV